MELEDYEKQMYSRIIQIQKYKRKWFMEVKGLGLKKNKEITFNVTLK